MPKIKTLTLRALDPDAQHQFYQNTLGMKDLGNRQIGYGGEEAAITFMPADCPYSPESSDLYWKLTLAVPNIELACTQLAAQGVKVDAPRQFQEVGYLAHFEDPEGLKIELIEHWFKGDRPNKQFDSALLGGGAHLNLITLRAAAMAPIEQLVSDWGMQCMCVQPVTSFGFTLYFYAFTTEQPPSMDLRAVENRTWLYRRPYTVLEVQHVHDLDQTRSAVDGAAGYQGIQISSAQQPIKSNQLLITGDS